MDTVPHCSSKIDRLSSLPPELLLDVFDLAYNPDNILLEPLSKRLLPYFRRNLYRQIRISSQSSFLKLLRTICANSRLGELLLNLRIDTTLDTPALNDLETIINAFPRLVSFDTRFIESVDPFPSSSLSPLHSLSYRRDAFELHDLVGLSHFQNLTQLYITLNQSGLDTPLHPVTKLENLKTLAIRADPWDSTDSAEWPHHLPGFLRRCPKLTSLELSDTLDPSFIEVLPLLAPLLSMLNSLKLDIPETLDTFYGIVCDLYLPLFPNLQHLDLADNTVGRSLIANLRKLPLLSTLRFGPMTFLDGPTSNELLSLVDGPTRLPQLTRLVLDCVYATAGERWDMDKLEQAIVRSESTKITGWKRPDFGERFGIDDLRKIVAAGGSNGIEIVGSSVEAIAVWDAYQVERANRKVMKAFKTKSLEGLRWVRQSLPVGIPDIDFDKLDPNNLQLVKIDLPEENWFRLSLE